MNTSHARGVSPAVATRPGLSRPSTLAKSDGSGNFAADYGFPQECWRYAHAATPAVWRDGVPTASYGTWTRRLTPKESVSKFLSLKGQSPVIDVPPGVWDGKDGGQLLYEDVLCSSSRAPLAPTLSPVIGVPSVAIQGVDQFLAQQEEWHAARPEGFASAR